MKTRIYAAPAVLKRVKHLSVVFIGLVFTPFTTQAFTQTCPCVWQLSIIDLALAICILTLSTRGPSLYVRI